MKNFIYLGLILSLISCSYFAEEKPARAAKDLLTKEYAQKRKANIDSVHYQLQFDISDKDSFQGTTAVQFNLKKKMDLSLDFGGGQVQELLVNGEPVRPINYNGFYISIPENFQKLGPNSILVKYTHGYSKNGTGLYKYVDIKDGRNYLYSHFEPYDANKMFPCFDQPNLKATYTLKVLAPKGWEVITSVRETEKVERGQLEEWYFPQSAKFSTYTFSLHAGEYEVWEDVAKTKKQEIPLRLFARKSLAKYVKVDDWMTWTKQGFQFFEKQYSYPYPYVKYDQLIVPDFNFGAMENVASVTYNEDRFVLKGEKTRKQRRRLAWTLLHEMAHMWFGNLVTMDWWDDLWLNESFATHSSTVALVKATEFEEGWHAFNTRAKQSAYKQDQSSNTHPITQDCAHTKEAFANFDSITYGKGASVMRQLSFLIGEKSYKKALKSYFKKYEHSNTILDQFIAEMETASERELDIWKERWLKTAMLNDVEAHYTCKKGKINSFELFQTGTKDYPTLRAHKTRIAILKKYRGVYRIHRTVPVEYSGERTKVPKMIGKICPDILYPNYKDHDYVSVILDKKSLRNIESNLVNVSDPFLKTILWADLWQMVLKQKMDMSRYLEIAEYNGLTETNLDIITTVFGNVSDILNKYYPNTGQPWTAQRQVWIKFFEQAYITKINELREDSISQKIWFQKLLQIAESSDVLRLLEKVVKKHRSGFPLTFAVDQDMRWKILTSLSRNNYEGVESLVVEEAKKDKTKRGQLKKLFAETVMPNLEKKKELFDVLITQREEKSLGFLRTIMFGLFPVDQSALHKKFVDSFYAALKNVSETADQYYATSFASNLVPAFCDKKSSTQISNFLKAEKGLSYPVAKRLKRALFENERCYQMRKVLKSKGPRRENQAY